MKAIAWLGVVVAFAVPGIPATAVAAPSTDPDVRVSVSTSILRSGETLTARGRSSADCAWLVDWNNERRTATGRAVLATFVAPEVQRRTTIPLRVTCFFATPAPPAGKPPKPSTRPNATSQRIYASVPRSVTRTIRITVRPAGAVVNPPNPPQPPNPPGPGGELPGTGGPDLWILLAGLATLVVGASLIKTSGARDLTLPEQR